MRVPVHRNRIAAAAVVVAGAVVATVATFSYVQAIDRLETVETVANEVDAAVDYETARALRADCVREAELAHDRALASGLIFFLGTEDPPEADAIVVIDAYFATAEALEADVLEDACPIPAPPKD